MPKIYVDFRFIEIEYELWALEHLLDVVEQQIAFLRDQDPLRTFAELRERGWEHDEGERQLASQELAERQDYVIPRFFRGPYVVSLWACFESAVKEVGGYLETRRSASLSLRDVNADNELAQFRKYFDAILNFPLDNSEERLNFINDLRVVRHAIAHANGQRRGMSESKWQSVSQALKRRGAPPDEDRGFIVLPSEFTKQAFENVNASLRDLVSRARSA